MTETPDNLSQVRRHLGGRAGLESRSPGSWTGSPLLWTSNTTPEGHYAHWKSLK